MLGDGGGADPRISPEADEAAYQTLVDWLASKGIDAASAGDMTLREITDMAMGSGNQQIIDAAGTASQAYGAVPVEDPAMTYTPGGAR